jgi:glycosyltransferase involved in cell wall biosynthesis
MIKDVIPVQPVKPKKVLMVITLSEMGGAQKVLYHIAAGLDPAVFDVSVACAPGGELVRWLHGLRQVRVVEIDEMKRDISPLNDIKALLKLFALMKKNKYDIVHCHSSKAGVLGRLAAWLAGVPRIIFTVHGWSINEYQGQLGRFLYIWAERLAGSLSTKVVCVSENDFMKGKSLKLVAAKKLGVIYNGMPAPVNKKGALRRELGIGEDDLVIGTVARLAAQKDPLFLLEAANEMLSYPENRMRGKRPCFVLIGDGPLRQECEEYIESKGLKGNVFLLGTREEAAILVRDFDVFVLFSRWEGLPLTIIEAMLAGVPVVANNVGGVGELVDQARTGYLINKLHTGEAVEALEKLIFNREHRLSLGESGRQKALALFSVDKMVKSYYLLYLS